MKSVLWIQHSRLFADWKSDYLQRPVHQTINFCENIRCCDSVMRIAADRANNSLHVESITSTLQKSVWPQLISYQLNYNGRQWRYLIRRSLISLYMYEINNAVNFHLFMSLKLHSFHSFFSIQLLLPPLFFSILSNSCPMTC